MESTARIILRSSRRNRSLTRGARASTFSDMVLDLIWGVKGKKRGERDEMEVVAKVVKTVAWWLQSPRPKDQQRAKGPRNSYTSAVRGTANTLAIRRTALSLGLAEARAVQNCTCSFHVVPNDGEVVCLNPFHHVVVIAAYYALTCVCAHD